MPAATYGVKPHPDAAAGGVVAAGDRTAVVGVEVEVMHQCFGASPGEVGPERHRVEGAHRGAVARLMWVAEGAAAVGHVTVGGAVHEEDEDRTLVRAAAAHRRHGRADRRHRGEGVGDLDGEAQRHEAAVGHPRGVDAAAVQRMFGGHLLQDLQQKADVVGARAYRAVGAAVVPGGLAVGPGQPPG